MRTHTEAMAELRRRAEERLHDVEKSRHWDDLQLVHELDVAHVELELQNEELRRAQVLLEDARDRYRSRGPALDRNAGFLEKPFDEDELSRAVRRLAPPLQREV